MMVPPGFTLHDGFLDLAAQRALVEAVREVARAAPMIRPVTPWGKPMSVAMTSAGRVGWVTDRKGYRYEPRHPEGAPWPPIPCGALAVWRAVSGWDADPDCCLVNFYREGAKMGLHRDEDEGEFAAPVVSISLGDAARFRMGGTARKDPTTAVRLSSGDVVVMGGPARLAYHGVDRIYFGDSPLLPDGGRLNLTLRVVRDPDPDPETRS
ncbi:MAG: alpha-ketoglutarate-dependent dioxygenase AlkB [Pseudomonadota bacterium]